MPQVDVTINGRRYQIACDEGQEQHLEELGTYVDKRVQELVATVGQVGDQRLLVMASLLIADELSEAFTALDESGNGVERDGKDDDDAFAAAIESVAQRIEDIAAGLEGT